MIKSLGSMVKMINYRKILIYLISLIRVFLRIKLHRLCLRFKRHKLKLGLSRKAIMMEYTELCRGLRYDKKLKKMIKGGMSLLESNSIKIIKMKLAETKLQDI